MEINIYHRMRDEMVINEKLNKILNILWDMKRKEEIMAGELDALKTAVAENTTVIGSAIVLLQGLKAKLDAAIASGDPAKLTALSTEIGVAKQALADAIVANTPVE